MPNHPITEAMIQRRAASRGQPYRRLALCLSLAVLPALAAEKPAHSSDAQALCLWPAPPATARVACRPSLHGPADAGIRPSRWRRFANWFTGNKSTSQRFIKPLGVAVDEANNLCVTDPGAGAVWFIDRTRKRFKRWERIGPYRLATPVAVAKRKDTFFVADSGLGKVLSFDAKGKLRLEITNHLTRPTGLALTAEQLYVADPPAHRIVVFDWQGRFRFQFGHRGAAPGEFNFPTHLAVDASGKLYVTDSMNFRVQIFDATGHVLGVIGSLGDGSGHFSRPKGVATDTLGHVYVVDALFDNFQIFDPAGRFLLAVGSAGSAPGAFWLPAGIAINRDNQIFVADSYNRRVQVFQYLGRP